MTENVSKIISSSIGLTLLVNGIVLAFSTGVIYQRVVSLEYKADDTAKYREKSAEILAKIQESVARIDERLKVNK